MKYGYLLGLVTFSVFSSFMAQPAKAVDRLYYPYVEQGEWEAEYFGTRSVDRDETKDDAQKQQFSLAYGATDFWKTEFYAKYEKEPGESLAFDAWEWENIFQFTERGENMVDVGASLAYEYKPQTNRADTLEARLLLAKDIDKMSHTLNINFEKDVGAGPKAGLEGAFVWSSRYSYSSMFDPGVEFSGELGELEKAGRFKNHAYYMGPVAYGKLPFKLIGEANGLKYRLGYLFGLSEVASTGQAIAQIEYEASF